MTMCAQLLRHQDRWCGTDSGKARSALISTPPVLAWFLINAWEGAVLRMPKSKRTALGTLSKNSKKRVGKTAYLVCQPSEK